MPKFLGETGSGEPIFEIHSVRLVLHDGSSHFNRLAACSKCGSDVPGAPVRDPGHLGHPAHSVICKDCVKIFTSQAGSTHRSGVSGHPRPDAAPRGPEEPGQDERQSVVDAVLAGLKRRLTDLTGVVQLQRTEMEAASAVMARKTEADLTALAAGAEEMARAQQELGRTLDGAVEQLESLAAFEAGSADSLQAPVPEEGSERLDALEERLRELLLVEAEVARAHAESLQAAEQHVEKVVEHLTGRVERELSQLRASLGANVGQLQANLDRDVGEVGADVARVTRGNAQLDRAQEALVHRLDSLAEHVQLLHGRVDAENAGAEAASATPERDYDELARVEEQLGQRAERLAERMFRISEADCQRLDALESRVEEAVERLAQSEEAQSERRAALDARVDELATALDREASRAKAHLVRIRSDDKDLGRAHQDLARRFDQVVELAQRVEASVDADAARAQSESATRVQATSDLARIEEQARETVAGIPEVLESLRQELRAGLSEGLAEVRSAAPATVSDRRLEALEQRLERSDDEMADLGELHAALDMGLGALRTEIADVRGAVKKVVGDQAEVLDRLESSDRSPQTAVPADSGRGRKAARKAEAGSHLAAAIEAAETLAREHQQLKAQVARLEQEAGSATAAGASQAAETAPLRRDVELLQEQMAAQNEALATLSRAVERLRRKSSTPAATKPARKATQD